MRRPSRRVLLPFLAALAATVAAVALAAPGLAATSLPVRPLLAPAATCPGQSEPGGPNRVQVKAMRCLVNFARQGRGLTELAASAPLDRAAAHKSADILRCNEFDHEACGRPFTYWMEQSGYLSNCTSAGENIAWGNGALGSPRAIFRAWMHSAGHRENILGAYDDIGIGLRLGTLEGTSGAHVWTQNFGKRC